MSARASLSAAEEAEYNARTAYIAGLTAAASAVEALSWTSFHPDDLSNAHGVISGLIASESRRLKEWEDALP